MNELTETKRAFSRIGWALFTYGIVTSILQIFVSILWLVYTAGTSLEDAEWATWLLTFAPMYLVAVPIALIIMRTVPAEPQESKKLGAKKFWTLMLICMPVMYAGNIIGTILSLILSGGTAVNALVDLVSGNPVYTLLFAVIAAPILEEYIFRKQIIDRLGRYGEKTAILVSALTFGLFHMNLFQFFYAFGLGTIFAYVYTRTRSIRYPIFMHMIINFQGSIIAPWVLEQLDTAVLDQLMEGNLDLNLLTNALPGLLVYMVYSAVILLTVVAGFVLLLLNWKKRQITDPPQKLTAKTVLCNGGMFAFGVFSLIMILYALLSGLI